jgi:hypothetical protein
MPLDQLSTSNYGAIGAPAGNELQAPPATHVTAPGNRSAIWKSCKAYRVKRIAFTALSAVFPEKPPKSRPLE